MTMADLSASPCSCVFSPDRKYRYALTREWLDGEGTVMFVLLNGSTADEEHNDPTLRRLIGFARSWGYRRLLLGNAFGYRSTNPHDLLKQVEPVGPDNDAHLIRMAAEASLVICGWGNWGKVKGRSSIVHALLAHYRPMCFGLTGQGEPRHPLYLSAKAELVLYA